MIELIYEEFLDEMATIYKSKENSQDQYIEIK